MISLLTSKYRLSKRLVENWFIEGVSPTNNHAERQLRPLVISKKLTFGTQSSRGSRFIERIFTIVTTCKQQNRDILAFLVERLQKYFLGEKGPSLVLEATSYP